MTEERGNRWLKFADFYAGISLIQLLGVGKFFLARKGACEVRSGARVGVLAPGAIGDTLLASALIGSLKAACNPGPLVLITSRANRAAASLLPVVSEHVVIPITRPISAVRIIRRLKLDVLVDIGPWPRISAALAALSGASLTVGFRTPGQYRHQAFDVAVDHSSVIHQSGNFAALAGALSVPMLPFGRLSLQCPQTLADRLPKRFVVFHAWPGGYRSILKQWPAEHWRDLAISISDLGLSIVLTGAAADVENSARLAHLLASAGVPVCDFAGACSLSETAGILSHAIAVVSVDTGVMHMSSLMERPTISLHGPTKSIRWKGVGRNSHAIDSDHPAAGYASLGFEDPPADEDTMRAIRPAEVLQALLAIAPEIVKESTEMGHHGR